MITGRSFVAHGVVRRGQVLADEERTLAEYMKDAGYRTIGISTNANNSVAHGSDQGYDRFVEVWHGREVEQNLDPSTVTELALEQLSAAAAA